MFESAWVLYCIDTIDTQKSEAHFLEIINWLLILGSGRKSSHYLLFFCKFPKFHLEIKISGRK